MRASGLRPTQVVYNTMLSACERGKDLPRALGLLQEMISEGVARDVITWNTIISVCKECGDWSRACALLDEMRAVDGIAPDTISYNAAVAACAKAGAVEEARRLLVRMRTENVTRDTCTYNSLMDGYARAGSFPAVLQTLEQMARDEKGSQARPDVISYTQALSAAEKTGDFEAADRLLAQMKAAGVKWNQYTYAVVMAICEKTGRWPQALKLLQAMRRRGLTPDSTCYTVVMKACASAGKLGHCLALLQAMRDDGVTPTIHIYTILLTAAIQAGQLRTGISLYHDMLAAAVRPNGVFVSAVLHALVEAGLNPSARAVLRRVARDPALRLDLAEFHVLLRAICRKGHLALAQDVLRHMEAAGVPPDVTAYNYIMLGYAAQGDAAATSALAAEMTRRGLEPNVFTFINLVRACAVAGCPERALAIVDPAFPWDFYSAAITIFHQYGCFPQADALYAAAVQHGRAPVDPDRQLAEEGLLDLHGLSSPVAAAAVRYALKRVRARWRREGPAAVQDMVLISGLGKGSLVPFSPTIRPLVQDLLVEQYYPPIDSTTVPGNAGRVVVSRESLLAWLEGDGDKETDLEGQIMAGVGATTPQAPGRGGGAVAASASKRPQRKEGTGNSSSNRQHQQRNWGGRRSSNSNDSDMDGGPPLPAGFPAA